MLGDFLPVDIFSTAYGYDVSFIDFILPSIHFMLLQWVQDVLHVPFNDNIRSPPNSDIASSLGSVQRGIAHSIVHRPPGGPTVIASKSYVTGIGDIGATWSVGTKNSINAAAIPSLNEVSKYLSDLDNCTPFLVALMKLLPFQGTLFGGERRIVEKGSTGA